MIISQCPKSDRLKAFYLGQLPDEQSEEFASHVSACDVCQAELETVEDSEDSIIASLREVDESALWDREPACEIGILRALGAFGEARKDSESRSEDNSGAQPIPSSIGEYEILRSLGSGGMGRVYLARHQKLGRLVALKVLAGHRAGDPNANKRFDAEMRLIGGLSHPNIVTAHDAREIDGTAVLVTEYVEGLDLGELVHRTGPLAIADVCEIIRQVSEALHYTCEQGLVHRDVKPSNIMLSHLGEVKLLDLGLARLQFGENESADITCTGQTMGTADYISPEQVADSRNVDIRSDIYSLGATMFKLLTGRAPFANQDHTTAFAKMSAHVSVVPESVRAIRKDVSLELDRLVASMLSKRPEDRPQHPKVVVEKLSQLGLGNDLKGLVQRANASTKPNPQASATPVEVKPKTQTIWDRPVPFYRAVAAGFFGMILGVALGVIITITNRDGSKTNIEVPDTSKIEIERSASAPMDGMAQTNNSSRPLEFALLMNREATGKEPFIKDKELQVLLEQLPRTHSDAIVQNDKARFVRIEESAGGDNPIFAWNNGLQYALISIDPKYSVTWDEINGRILESELIADAKSRESQLRLRFDKTLGEKLRRVTSSSLGHHLGIIVENKIVQAPRVNSEVGSEVMITGIFSEKQLSNMRQYLHLSQKKNGEVVTTQTTTATVVVKEYDIDFGSAMKILEPYLAGERSEKLSFVELEDLASKIVSTTSWARDDSATARRAIASTWQMNGIKKIKQGLNPNAAWLAAVPKEAYTMEIAPQQFIADVKKFADSWSGQNGMSNDIIQSIKEDPLGPKMDLEKEFFSLLGDEIVAVNGSSMIAFAITDIASAKKHLEQWHRMGLHAFGTRGSKVIGSYLVFGNKEELDAASKRLDATLGTKSTTDR